MSSELEVRQPATPSHPQDDADDAPEPSLTTLTHRLIEDGRALVRQEIALAKAEALETVADYARAGALVAAGGFAVLVGLVVLLVFVVIALGVLLGDRYWLSTLIVGLIFAVGGMVTIRRAKARLRADRLVPDETIDSLRATAGWAAEQAGRLKNETPERSES